MQQIMFNDYNAQSRRTFRTINLENGRGTQNVRARRKMNNKGYRASTETIKTQTVCLLHMMNKAFQTLETPHHARPTSCEVQSSVAKLRLRPRLRPPARPRPVQIRPPHSSGNLRPRGAAWKQSWVSLTTTKPNPPAGPRCSRVSAMVTPGEYIRPGGVWYWKTVSSLTSILLQF